MIVEDQVTKVRLLFDKLAHCKKKSEKQAVIYDIDDDEVASKTLFFLLTPHITTGIGKKSLVFKMPQVALPPPNADIEWFLNYASIHNTGKQNDINMVCIWLDRLRNTENYIFMRDIITKQYRIGVTAKTVNETLGYAFIPAFEVMLAHKYSEHPEYVRGNFCITEKLDGIRCYAKLKDGVVKLFTRQGQLIEGLVDVTSRLFLRFGKQEIDLDGELVVSNYHELPSKIAYKETTKIVRKKGIKHGITYRVFDIPSPEPYSERRKLLEQYIPESENGVVVHVPALYIGDNTAMIDHHLKNVCAAGGEGVMINMMDAPYEYKRSSKLLKVKQMQDCDLEVVGFQEGEGKLKGTLGALIVDYKGNPLYVGTGFTMKDRQYFWSNQDSLLGRVVSVQYFEETTDDTGKPSLRFPVFLELREDGKEVAY